MSDLRLRRVTKEIARAFEVQVSSFLDQVLSVCVLTQGCNNDYKTDNVSVEQMNDSPFHLRGSFQGPQDSPYEGGTFEVVRSAVIVIFSKSTCMIYLAKA